MTLQQQRVCKTQLLEGGNQKNPQSVVHFYNILLNTTTGMSRRVVFKVISACGFLQCMVQNSNGPMNK